MNDIIVSAIILTIGIGGFIAVIIGAVINLRETNGKSAKRKDRDYD